MITRNQLTTTTPSTLILGIATRGSQTAITGALRLRNGNMESDVITMVGGDVWQAIDEAMNELRIIYQPHLMLLTTCDEFCEFLQRPIRVEQPDVKKVWVGRDVFTVRTGGNVHKWSILRHLFRYVWRCERVAVLSKAEGLLK